MDSEQFKQEAEKIEQSLSALRVAERNAVIPFMNGDFTQWDLYLASSSEYAMRLIDGFISMLESRNLVCVAQLLRAQVGVCLRTFALFAAEDQDDFLKQVFQGVPVNKLKDFSGEKISDGRLQDLLEKFDPKVKDVYKVTSGFVHFSIDICRAWVCLGRAMRSSLILEPSPTRETMRLSWNAARRSATMSTCISRCSIR